MSEAWSGGKGDKTRVSDLESYRDNYERIFGKKETPKEESPEEESDEN